MSFLDILFPNKKIEAKVEDLINLRQGGMSVKEYSLMFMKISKYASSLVSNARDEIRRYVRACLKSFKKNVMQPWFMTICIFLD